MSRKQFAMEQREKYPNLLCPVIDPDARLIWPYVKVGRNVGIGPGCVIGFQGVGYIKNDNEWLHIPHVGNVIIGDNVSVYPGAHIQRGTLEDTVIGDGTIIGHNCNIAHNCKIGKNCMLTNNVIVSGSVEVGDNVYIAPGVIIRDHVKIADNVCIGQDANVLGDLVEGDYWYTGTPARRTREVREGEP